MNLRREEFLCKCGCGKLILDSMFFGMLCRAREIADTPFVINSGYRCEKHNADVGSKSINHTSGRAADIKAVDGPTRGKILKGLMFAGFRRFGIGRDYIHVDSTDNVESTWLY